MHKHNARILTAFKHIKLTKSGKRNNIRNEQNFHSLQENHFPLLHLTRDLQELKMLRGQGEGWSGGSGEAKRHDENFKNFPQYSKRVTKTFA